MHCKSIALILAGIMANRLMASPLSSRDSTETMTSTGYTELYREETKLTSGDYLVYYGPSNETVPVPSSEPVSVDRRASSPCSTTASPKCDTKHGARNDVCDQLVTELQGDSQILVPQAPRQICYEGVSESNAYCCVSWHNVVPNLNKGDLAGYANTILAQCTSNGISGKIDNVKVFNTCTDVCLSNRGNHC